MEENAAFHVLGEPRVNLIEEIDACQLENGGVGVDYDDIIEMAIACVHVNSIALRTGGAMDVRVGHEHFISFHDPERLQLAIAYHQEVEGDFACARAIHSTAHRIAIQDKVIHDATVGYLVGNIIVVEV